MAEEGDLFSMEMEIWVGVRKNPMATTPSKRALSLIPRVEEPTSATALNPPPTSELEGAVSPEDLALVPRRWPLPPPGFLPWAQMTLQYCLRRICMGMDLTALKSLQVTISHTPATGEVHYHLQAQSITRRSLSGTSPQEHLKPLSKDQGTLSNHYAPLYSGNTSPKQLPE